MCSHPCGVGVATLHQRQQLFGNVHLGQTRAPGQAFDGVQAVVTCERVFSLEHRRAEHQLHQCAGAGDDLGPVGVADGTQGGNRVAHAQVVGGLVGGLLDLSAGQVWLHPRKPALQRDLFHTVARGPMVLQAQR